MISFAALSAFGGIFKSEEFQKVMVVAAIVAIVVGGAWYVRSLTGEIAELESDKAVVTRDLVVAEGQRDFWKSEADRIQVVLEEKQHNERVNSEQMGHLLAELRRLQEEFPDVAKLYKTNVPDPVLDVVRRVRPGGGLPEGSATEDPDAGNTVSSVER